MQKHHVKRFPWVNCTRLWEVTTETGRAIIIGAQGTIWNMPPVVQINTLSAIVEDKEATNTDADVLSFMHKANALNVWHFDEKDNVLNLVNNGEDCPHLACMIVMKISSTRPRMKLQLNG